MSKAAMRIASLKCEHLSTPSGIDERVPRLSWTLESEERGQRQTAYQILVSESERDLAEGKATLWDSGKVSSDRTVGIVYGGKELLSGMRCFWKVRAWDKHGRPTEYSPPARWGMGLLNESDWLGEWIGLGEGAARDKEPPEGSELGEELRGLEPCPYLRKAFELDKPLRRATLYATARGLYELRLNGSRVGNAVLRPGWTDYDKRIQYQTYDVTEMLSAGQSVLGCILGEGWFSGYVGFDPKRRGAHYGTSPSLLLQLNLEYTDGTKLVVASDGSWRSSVGPIIFSDLLMGETYDARREMPGWDEPGFDDSGWRSVSVEDAPSAKLVAERSQPVEVTREIEAAEITEPVSGTYVVDMGQNMVGWVRLKVHGEPGTNVRLRHAEALNPDGTIYTKNLRTARQTDTYILKGESEETFEPRFTFHGFRYVEITDYPGEPSLDAITGCVVHSNTPPIGTFECSDPVVNKLQSNIVWGQRGNFLSVPTDCPQRDERLGWMGDAQIFVRTACFNMDVSAFFTKWMADVEDAQSSEGGFPDVAPRLAVITDGAPAWGDAGIIVPWTIYQNYSDTRIIEKHYDAMVRWMDYIQEANPDLLRTERLGNNYGDWLSVGADTPKDVLATAYWAYDARLMAQVARAIGRQVDAERYERLFEGIKVAFNHAYVSSEGRIKGETQTCYVLALHMDLLPDTLRSAAARHLVEDIEKRGGHLSTGFIGVGYLCPVLTQTGHLDVAYSLLHNDTFPSWGYSIKRGATTIWERWDGWTEEKGFQTPEMNSFNHYSLGSVGEWLYQYVAGIDMDAQQPGYEHIVIRPHPGGGLIWAKAQYDSIRGRILSNWRIEDGKFLLKVTIPANTTGTVYIPGAGKSEITESGEPAECSEGVRFLHAEDGAVAFAVQSGRYEFVGRGIPISGPLLA